MLEQIFSQYGTVLTVYLPLDLDHNYKPKGFGFVRYGSLGEANRAINEADGIEIFPHQYIKVSRSEPKTYFSPDESIPNPNHRIYRELNMN